jgi:hypothetical protein
LAPLLENEAQFYLADPNRSLIMSDYYIFLPGVNSIVGLSLTDLSVSFRFPFQGRNLLLPLSYVEPMKSVVIATQKHFYRISLERERPPVTFRKLATHKPNIVAKGQPDMIISRAEILSSLLEADDFALPIKLLSCHLLAVLSKSDLDKTTPLTRSKLEHLCEEFLLYELQIIECCKQGTAEYFNPKFHVSVDCSHFDSFAAIQQLIHLRAFSPVSWKARDATILDQAEDSPNATRQLLEDGKIFTAVERLRQFGPIASALSVIIFNHFDKLGVLYDQVRDPAIARLIIAILPFISDNLPPDCALILLDAALRNRTVRELDMLIASLCKTGSPEIHDLAISERLLKISDRAQLFDNPFSVLQDLQTAGFRLSAAALASSLQLWGVAVKEASMIEVNLAKRYIHRAPRKLQAELCREANIEIGREDGEAVRIVTKEAVCEELVKMTEELEQLTKESEQSAQFLKELEEWGAGECRSERNCGGCRKLLVRTIGYKFPCGHCFHEKCLIRMVKEILSAEEIELLNGILGKPRPSKSEMEQREILIAGDCPLCGEKATTKILRSVVPPESNQWSFGLTEAGTTKGGGSLLRIFANRP